VPDQRFDYISAHFNKLKAANEGVMMVNGKQLASDVFDVNSDRDENFLVLFFAVRNEEKHNEKQDFSSGGRISDARHLAEFRECGPDRDAAQFEDRRRTAR
jgi:hypothetical protein